MVTRRGKKTDQTSEELKSSILAVARKHFAKHGMNGASLKEIAADAGVAGSLINYHFKDKESLFKSCLESFSSRRTETVQRILQSPESPEEIKVRLELFIEEMQSLMLDDDDTFEMVDREMQSQNPVVDSIFEETILLSFKTAIAFFAKAKQNKLLVEDADPMILATVLFTSCCDSVRKNELAKRFFNVSFEDPAYRRKYAQQIAALFIKGVLR